MERLEEEQAVGRQLEEGEETTTDALVAFRQLEVERGTSIIRKADPSCNVQLFLSVRSTLFLSKVYLIAEDRQQEYINNSWTRVPQHRVLRLHQVLRVRVLRLQVLRVRVLRRLHRH
ncbi:unnamed protein product [Amoebophrya sp. A25]|nr:unnamed protein product [Amoebophrya sp. A25]|eukprot:GSA25T00024748001.1